MTDTHEKATADVDAKGEMFSADTPMSSTADLFEDGSVDPVYQAKARVLNSAMQEIGMGKYQVRSCFVERYKVFVQPCALLL